MGDEFLKEQLERVRQLTERMAEAHERVTENTELMSHDREAVPENPLHEVRDYRPYPPARPPARRRRR